MLPRRSLMLLFLLAPLKAASAAVRGRLRQNPALLETADGRRVRLEAQDAATAAVLADERLAGADCEAHGEWRGGDAFRIDPIHTRPLFVYRGGKLLRVTYWCAVCSVREARPGKCRCCQEEMELDPRDPALGDEDPAR